MDVKNNNTPVTLKFFKLEDKQVYVQLECKFTEQELQDHQESTQIKKQKRKSNLLLFLDKSGSMSGSYMDVLKKSCIQIGREAIFVKDEDDQLPFHIFNTIVYNDRIQEYNQQTDLNSWIQMISNIQAGSRTDFIKPFENIMNTVSSFEPDCDCTILFFTDGCDTCNNTHSIEYKLNQMKQILLDQTHRGITTKVLTIGLSQHHDSKLLNALAQAGSELGNFIYIDTDHPDCLKQISDSLEDSMQMAMTTQEVRMSIKSDQTTKLIDCETIRQDGHVEYFCSAVLPDSVLDDTMLVNIQLTPKIELPTNIKMVEVQEVSPIQLNKARLILRNQRVFQLIQKIQQDNHYKDCLQEFITIKEQNQTDMQDIMKIKDRFARKELMTQLTACQERCSGVLELLRDNQKINNEVIARLNDLAYRGIKKGLQKMVDKRALKNEETYKQNEQQCHELVSTMDFTKLRQEQAQVVDQVGTCVVSTMDTLEAMQDYDCMCIGLSIQRPEAAIADPSRLIIKGVFPSYMTSQSFIHSATFNIQKYEKAAHGGFQEEEGRLVVGQARENITGVMGLYLFQEHWQLVNKNIQPIYGLMCTLDVMGYSSEQYFTIPFLVYQYLLAHPASTQMDHQITHHVQQTCHQIILRHKQFTIDTIHKITQFVHQPSGESTRTKDIIKSVDMLLIWYYTILQIHHQLGEQAHPLVQPHFKLAFVRQYVEETLRRHFQNIKQFGENKELLNLLFPDHAQFINNVFDRKKKEIKRKYEKTDSPNQQNNKWAQEARILMEKLGYEVSKEEDQIDEQQKQDGDNKEKIEQEETVDFHKEVQTILQDKPWGKCDLQATIDPFDQALQKRNKFQMELLSSLMDDQSMDSLFTTPLLGDTTTEKQEVLLAMLIQNSFQAKNSDRTEAVRSKVYHPLDTGMDSTSYLNSLISKYLLNDLKGKESALIQTYLDQQSNEAVQEVLRTQNHFQAAVAIHQYRLSSGRGDFSNMIKVLLQQDPTPYQHDLTNKIMLIRNQAIFTKQFMDQHPTIHRNDVQQHKYYMRLNSDKTILPGIRQSRVFQMWSKFVYTLGLIPVEDYARIFPEYQYQIHIWSRYCDEKGEVKKKLEEYNQMEYREYRPKAAPKKLI